MFVDLKNVRFGAAVCLETSGLSGEARVVSEVWINHTLLFCVLQGPPEWGNGDGSETDRSRYRFVYTETQGDIRLYQIIFLDNGQIVPKRETAGSLGL